jgi:signal transduction histidine kinase/ligand-binding sensor domain-containing protein
LLSIGSLFAASPESAWSLRVWRSDDGLPNNNVTGLAQTPDGYLWVATYSTPARFDGVQFEEFFPRDFNAGSNQKITALALGRSGGLWMGALHGAVLFLNSSSVQTFSDGSPDKRIETLVEGNDGSVWIVYQSGVVGRLKEGRITVLGEPEGLPPTSRPDHYVCSLTRDRAGEIWFAKGGQIGVFRGDGFETRLQLDPANAQIVAAKSGGLWLAHGGQLYRFHEGKSPERRGVYGAPRTSEPTALIEDSSGGVWIGTAENGVFHYDGARIDHPPSSDPKISALLEDSKGGIWVGTARGGLGRIGPRRIELQAPDPNRPLATVQSSCEAGDGSFWATTEEGALLHRVGDTWRSESIDTGWPGEKASCVVAGEDNQVWIGTKRSALYLYSAGRFTALTKDQGLIGREIHGLLAAKNGDLWIAEEMPDVVQRLRHGKLDTFSMPADVRVIRAMAEDSEGSIWVGTSKGRLIRITSEKVIDETSRTTGEPLSIRALHATPDGSLWVGYADEGLGWIKDGRFVHFTDEQGFPENNLSQIVADGRGWLWLAGDHGIFKVSLRDLTEAGAHPSFRPHYIRYGKSDGLESLEATCGDSPGALRTREGVLWIPMRTTLAIVHPDRVQPDAEPPPTLLKRVRVDEQTVASYGGVVPVRDGIDLPHPQTQLRLAPGHHRIEFDFTAINFAAPENVRFRYRLDGFEDGWIEATAERTANYSRLPEGHYCFQLQACNADGAWTEKVSLFAFSVAPYFWQTWWFRLIVLTGVTSLTAWTVRIVSGRRMRAKLRLLEQQAALDRERSRIARDLHDELGTRLTELGLIAELDGGRPADERRARALVEQIRSLERDLDTIVWTINPTNDSLEQLVGFICRMASEFLGRAGIRCRLDLPEEFPSTTLSPELRHHVSLVAREALNNVVKHARATLVKLGVAVHHNSLHLWIEDDGVGIDQAKTEASERNGLKNMKNRAEELGGDFTVESGPGRGTCVRLIVPIDPDRPLDPTDPRRLGETRSYLQN